jgi:hypothetical protein
VRDIIIVAELLLRTLRACPKQDFFSAARYAASLSLMNSTP